MQAHQFDPLRRGPHLRRAKDDTSPRSAPGLFNGFLSVSLKSSFGTTRISTTNTARSKARKVLRLQMPFKPNDDKLYTKLKAERRQSCRFPFNLSLLFFHSVSARSG